MQTGCGEVAIWPSDLIAFPSPAFAFILLAQDTAQASSRIAVDCFVNMRWAMFEIAKPTFQGSVQVQTDCSEAPAATAAGLAPYGVLELIQALLARPSGSPLKVVT